MKKVIQIVFEMNFFAIGPSLAICTALYSAHSLPNRSQTNLQYVNLT